MIQSFLCIPHIPVGYAGGRAPTVGALGDAGAVAESFALKVPNLEIVNQQTNDNSTLEVINEFNQAAYFYSLNLFSFQHLFYYSHFG
ncbi:MAG TPA: hypothetical protein VIF37_14725 [Methylobacter sp.]|jgi:hypothetical protein